MARPVLALSPQPLYSQIREVLRAAILDGSYPPHAQVPSESELMVQHGVSRITVRQALADLQNEGLIFKVHGKGSFVSKPKAFQNVTRLQGFAEAMAPLGYETFSKVLALRTAVAPPKVSEAFGIAPKSRLTQLTRLRFLNREPISVDVSWFTLEVGERLAKADLASRDVFAVLENDLGIALGHADIQIEAALVDEAHHKHLKLEPGSPVMQIQRLTYSASGQPVDFEHLYFRGDSFQYRFQIDRASPARAPINSASRQIKAKPAKPAKKDSV
jgi:GntR family transcriptional regulator